VVAGIDLTGKRAIVIGASSGIGIETARALAGVGTQVTFAVRNTQAGSTARVGGDAARGPMSVAVESRRNRHQRPAIRRRRISRAFAMLRAPSSKSKTTARSCLHRLDEKTTSDPSPPDAPARTSCSTARNPTSTANCNT
jgi:NAD(P)-dependent dehydrogenase (short-subunit alcohol dehydrogenase family)